MENTDQPGPGARPPGSAAPAPTLRERLIAYGAQTHPAASSWAEALVAAVWEGACRGQAPLIKLLLEVEAAGPGPSAWLDALLDRLDAADSGSSAGGDG